MTLLDFSEIPPSKSPSEDLSAFEKFAKDFFITLYGATILKTVGRGADSGADIVVQVESERWLVSCKFYEKNSIRRGAESSPLGDLQQWGCHKFIGFYVPEPSAGLESKLRQTEANNPAFKFQIFDNKDIERNLISTSSSEGWMLAFRWFPKSSSKIAASLVRPISQYCRADIVRSKNFFSIHGLPTFISHNDNDGDLSESTENYLIQLANEFASEKIYSKIFLDRIKDFNLICAGAFIRTTFISDSSVSPYDIFPSWDTSVLRNLCAAQNRHALKSLCIVWSLWDLMLAQAFYYCGRVLIDRQEDILLNYSDKDTRNILGLVKDHVIKNNLDYYLNQVRNDLSFSEVTLRGRTLERGYYASLLCFCPSGLSAGVLKEYARSVLARQHGEEQRIFQAANLLMKTLSKDDYNYVRANQASLKDLLTSLNLVIENYDQEIIKIDSAIFSLRAPLSNTWVSEGVIDNELSAALGFS